MVQWYTMELKPEAALTYFCELTTRFAETGEVGAKATANEVFGALLLWMDREKKDLPWIPYMSKARFYSYNPRTGRFDLV